MAEKSKISWTDSTFNPWLGCTKVSPACDHCYAESWSKRSGLVEWGNNPRRRTSKQKWKEPLKWQRQADRFYAEHGRKRRVFCASLADVFDNQVDPAWRNDLWSLIRECDQLTWMLLTKRPQNIKKMLPEFWAQVQGHVWLGTTVENQAEAVLRIRHLVTVEGGLKFLSCEPLLGEVRLDRVQVGGKFMDYINGVWSTVASPNDTAGLCDQIDWVVCGGESGPHFRSPDPAYIRSLRDQARGALIPFHFKQWGGRTPSAGGHELDGEVIQEFPR